MLEKECIQSRGFRNIEENGEVTGFQVRIRSLYYRGVYLSQLRPAVVTVDGEVFDGESVTWMILGKTYTQKELEAVGDINWPLLEPATLRIAKPGGLTQGFHDIEVNYGYSASYMPPEVDEYISRRKRNVRRLVMV
ncbi:DUF6379 domain-containing protein [Oscillospiraceae bacterium OttesenSCG-928-F05]|nr:DUF6379 domain-containing protein [Oscillospiraceae bacterium OttesenSCG-928-F05]